jgi:hypothetical protein
LSIDTGEKLELIINDQGELEIKPITKKVILLITKAEQVNEPLLVVLEVIWVF